LPRKKLTTRQKKARRKKVNRANYLKTRHGTFESRLKNILYYARARARKNKLEFTISKTDYQPQTHCKLLPDRAFKFNSTRTDKENSMSIDRLDATKGYTPENTWLICHRANTIKSNATFEEFEMIYLNWKAELIRRGMKP
jgi:hypothetical protein